MAETNEKLTNVKALEQMVALIPEDNAELKAKGEAILAAEIRKRDKAKERETGPTKEQIQNLASVRKMLVMMDDAGEPVNHDWMGVHGGLGWETAHKAGGKMNRIAAPRGWVEKLPKKVSGKIVWQLTDEGRAEAERVRNGEVAD